MSNNVGALYQAVIEGVIREARLDFEEMGEQDSTLHLLQKEWQQRLSSMRVANYLPWDGLDDSALGGGASMYYGYDLSMPTLSGTQVPPNIGVGSGAPLSGVDSKQQSGGNIYVKDEASYGNLSYASGIQAGMPMGGGMSGVGRPGLQPMPQGTVPSQSGAGAGQHQPQPQSQPPPHLGGLELPRPGIRPDTHGSRGPPDLALPQMPQTDGTIAEGDVRTMIEGLMNQKQNAKAMRQVDGASDELVGSDLDDSEDELNSENEDEDAEQGMIMLCLYDKVQRVKSKWKYVLKDGIANINGSDYVFSRATGESEW